nr:PREDICTED: uncharacterized protein LOC109036955 [Bemisia tabaci]
MKLLIKLILVSFLITSQALCEEEDEGPKMNIAVCRCRQKYGYIDRGQDYPIAITTGEIVKIHGKEECRCNLGAVFLKFLKEENLSIKKFVTLHENGSLGPWKARNWLRWHGLKVRT